jgi:hypothetical protein
MPPPSSIIPNRARGASAVGEPPGQYGTVYPAKASISKKQSIMRKGREIEFRPANSGLAYPRSFLARAAPHDVQKQETLQKQETCCRYAKIKCVCSRMAYSAFGLKVICTGFSRRHAHQ